MTDRHDTPEVYVINLPLGFVPGGVHLWGVMCTGHGEHHVLVSSTSGPITLAAGAFDTAQSAALGHLATSHNVHVSRDVIRWR